MYKSGNFIDLVKFQLESSSLPSTVSHSYWVLQNKNFILLGKWLPVVKAKNTCLWDTFTLFSLSLFSLKCKKITVCPYSNFLFLKTAVRALKISHQASLYNTFILFPHTVFLFVFPLHVSSRWLALCLQGNHP